MNYIVVKQTKSLGVAIILTFAFGPIGLFYSSITGGLIMTSIPLFLGILLIVGVFNSSLILFLGSLALLILFAVFYWFICVIWAAIAVSSYNNKIIRGASNTYHPQTNTYIQKASSESTSDKDLLILLLVGSLLIGLVIMVYKYKHLLETFI